MRRRNRAVNVDVARRPNCVDIGLSHEARRSFEECVGTDREGFLGMVNVEVARGRKAKKIARKILPRKKNSIMCE